VSHVHAEDGTCEHSLEIGPTDRHGVSVVEGAR
jgi:hypothetical protein